MNRTRTTRLVAATAAAAMALAACGDGGDGEPAADGSLQVEAGDMYLDPESLSADAGEVSVTLENVGGVEHDFVIEEEGDELVVHSDPGETNTGTIDLDAGTYTYYCSIPGHRATMEGTLEVS